MRATERPVSSGGSLRWRELCRTSWIYALLLGGGAVFAWPFVWMIFASVKTPRELFSENARVLPQTPIPRARSPYIDQRWFPPPRNARAQALLALVEVQLRRADYAWPAGLARDDIVPAVARGIVKKLSLSQPDQWWAQTPDAWRTDLPGLVNAALIDESLNQVERSLVLGQLTANSYDLQEDLLVSAAQESPAWRISGPGSARLLPARVGAAVGGQLDYDFTSGNDVRLTRTFTLDFPASRLHSLKLFLRSDDSWNRLNVSVEMGGRLYRSATPVVLADTNWIEAAWQQYGPDDRSNKIRTWIHLREMSRGPGFESDPHKIKVTFEVVKSGRWLAWWEKISQSYRLVLNAIPFGRYVSTSLFLVVLQMLGSLFSCSLVAYSFARLRWPGRRLCFLLMIATMIVPSQVTMIPHFLIMRSLGWYNTLYPLWIGSLFANAFFVFLLYQFLRGVPRDLEDAALIDGCGYWRIYWHVVLPLIRPSLATIAIFTFMGAWNDFMGPLIYLNDQRLYPLSLGLYALNVQSGGSMGMMMAGSLLMTLPVIAIFFFAQRYFIQGIALTGMK